ncbi:hypothetical protein PHMEG_00013612 [Phytophthora megakarya]|uniref:Uncharacterized protein n=1 Tax=Phytophthora megakarya TaxID=4795 RepID=A0A225W5Y0_9STRA|nr:hypothetical protein PHMEG_00013612 [Phytophthora megakarya]
MCRRSCKHRVVVTGKGRKFQATSIFDEGEKSGPLRLSLRHKVCVFGPGQRSRPNLEVVAARPTRPQGLINDLASPKPPTLQPPSSSRVSSLLLLLFAIDRWTTPPINKNHNIRSYTAIHAQLSYVKWYHRVYAGFEPNINTSHATTFAGMRRLSRPPLQKSPVTIGMLEWIANNIDFEIPQQRLIYGAALLGFYYLLRSSEYLSVKGGRHEYALEVQDVQVLDIAGRPAVNVRDTERCKSSIAADPTVENKIDMGPQLYTLLATVSIMRLL